MSLIVQETLAVQVVILAFYDVLGTGVVQIPGQPDLTALANDVRVTATSILDLVSGRYFATRTIVLTRVA